MSDTVHDLKVEVRCVSLYFTEWCKISNQWSLTSSILSNLLFCLYLKQLYKWCQWSSHMQAGMLYNGDSFSSHTGFTSPDCSRLTRYQKSRKAEEEVSIEHTTERWHGLKTEFTRSIFKCIMSTSMFCFLFFHVCESLQSGLVWLRLLFSLFFSLQTWTTSSRWQHLPDPDAKEASSC